MSERQPRAPREPKKSGLPVFPLIGLVFAVGVAVWVGNAASKNQKANETSAAERSADSYDPFGDVPDEQIQKRGKTGPSGPGAPDGLLSDAGWKAASQVAEEGYSLASSAKLARDSGDEAGYLRDAKAAKAKFNKALEDSALFEERIVDQYGDDDLVVTTIVKARSRWFKQVNKFRSVK